MSTPPIGQVRMRMRSDRRWLDLRGPAVCEVLDPAQVATLRGRLGADPLRDDPDPETRVCPDRYQYEADLRAAA